MDLGRAIRALGRVGSGAGDDEDARLRKSLLAYCALLITVLATVWVVTYSALELYAAAAIPALYQVASVVGLVVFARTKHFRPFRDVQLALMLVLPFLLQWTLGGFVAASAVALWALIAPMGSMMLGARPVPWFLAFLALLSLSAVIDPLLTPADVPDDIRLAFFVLNLGATSWTAFVLLHYFLRQRDAARDALDEQHRLLERERARSESLLLNVLPVPVAARLKDGERLIADRAEASVLFADMVGFTAFAATRPPEVVVELLGEVFTWLDDLADRFGLEKIKTVGDAYMAVAGLPDGRADHVAVAAEMALTVVTSRPPSMLAVGGPPQLRVGLDTGPVVAGVIGKRKFSYDLWGDTVNTASRMESTGVPGRVQVTRRVVDALDDRYRFEPRGLIEVKGKGPMPTWFLVGPRSREPVIEAVAARPAT